MRAKFKEFLNELKNVKTLGLAYIADNVFEKFFWITLGLLGIAWGFYFIPNNVNLWIDNPVIITRSDSNLSQIQFPAISIKPYGITKYAIAERLANYIKPENLPIELRKVRTLLLKCAIIEDHEYEVKSDKHYFTTFQNDCIYNFRLNDFEESICKVCCCLSNK